MTEAQRKELLILAGRANFLRDLRERKRISEAEYFSRLNGLRQEAGLDPIAISLNAGGPLTASAAWGS